MDVLLFQCAEFSCGNVDKANAVIRDVALITSGVTAEGHDLEVDGETLTQMLSCAKERGKVPVKLNHGSGIEALNGYLENFRLSGKKLIGDWHLLTTHEETPKMLERAERMPTCFGMSAAFKGEGVKIAGGKKAARCFALKSVDVVTAPAANPDGLFSEKVDTSNKATPKIMADENKNQTAKEPTLAELMAAVQGLQATIAEQGKVIEALQAGGNEHDQEISDEELEELANLGDEQLAEIGLTREQVLAEAAARGYEVSEGQGEGDGDGNGEGAMAGAGAGASAGGEAGSAAFEALRRDYLNFKARIKSIELAEKEAEEDAFFSALEEKIELAAKEISSLRAENAALKNTVTRFESQTGAVSASKPILFEDKGEQNHKFAALCQKFRAEGKTEGQAIMLAAKQDPAAHREWIQLQAGK